MPTWMSAAEQAELWDRYKAGEYMRPIARAIGRSSNAVRDLIAKTGGVRPLVPTEWSEARLSLAEREEISRGIAGGRSARQIAAGLGRAPSTISREIAVNGGRARLPVLRGRGFGPPARPATQIGQAGPAAGCGGRSRPSSKSTGHPSRSPTGCRRRSPTTRRCE